MLTRSLLPLALIALALAACDDDDPRADGGTDPILRDASADGALDGAPDPDLAPPADATPDGMAADLALDAMPDAMADAMTDATVDAMPDATVDMMPDATTDAMADAMPPDAGDCVPAGEATPVVPGAPPCCPGLIPIGCEAPGDLACEPCVGASICTACGDGECRDGENRCNCPFDCRDPRCDDGSELACDGLPPRCDGGVVAIRDGCWVCADPATCRRWGEPGCQGDDDCAPGERCDDCATSSCPDCDDCVAACVAAGGCPGPNPAGCRETGCPAGQECVQGEACIPSNCQCDGEFWLCTDDCGGGECVDAGGCPGPNPAGCRETGCPAGQACVQGDACIPSTCVCDGGVWACTEDCGGGECVAAAALQWFETCGDPVCRGHTPDPNIPRCDADQRPGDPCAEPDTRCDPVDECNVRLLCAAEDPRMGPCPISKAEHKQAIRYLDPTERRRYAAALLDTRLATWRYRQAPEARPSLGFIIDDGISPEAVTADGERVDLYGYTSLAVAAVQVQAEELAALRAELETLRARLDAAEAQCR